MECMSSNKFDQHSVRSSNFSSNDLEELAEEFYMQMLEQSKRASRKAQKKKKVMDL